MLPTAAVPGTTAAIAASVVLSTCTSVAPLSSRRTNFPRHGALRTDHTRPWPSSPPPTVARRDFLSVSLANLPLATHVCLKGGTYSALALALEGHVGELRQDHRCCLVQLGERQRLCLDLRVHGLAHQCY